jgi:hypothetical protein
MRVIIAVYMDYDLIIGLCYKKLFFWRNLAIGYI